MNRDEAIAAGHNKYITGKPCKNKHLSMRYTSNGMCCKCVVEANERRLAKVAEGCGIHAPNWLNRIAARVSARSNSPTQLIIEVDAGAHALILAHLQAVAIELNINYIFYIK